MKLTLHTWGNIQALLSAESRQCMSVIIDVGESAIMELVHPSHEVPALLADLKVALTDNPSRHMLLDLTTEDNKARGYEWLVTSSSENPEVIRIDYRNSSASISREYAQCLVDELTALLSFLESNCSTMRKSTYAHDAESTYDCISFEETNNNKRSKSYVT